MFEDLLGNMEQKQSAIKKKLDEVIIQENVNGIEIIGNANGIITNISITDDLLQLNRKEELEDLLIANINRFLEMSKTAEISETHNYLQDMFPSGFGDLIK